MSRNDWESTLSTALATQSALSFTVITTARVGVAILGSGIGSPAVTR
jgi:hypothetical protein